MRPFFAALLTVAALTACSGPASYVQTWPKTYDSTTCAEWQEEMSADQRFAAAGDLLWAHLQRNGAKERPTLSAIKDFRTVLGRGCADDGAATVADIGNGISLPD